MVTQCLDACVNEDEPAIQHAVRAYNMRRDVTNSPMGVS